jgi:hypothetical protein
MASPFLYMEQVQRFASDQVPSAPDEDPSQGDEFTEQGAKMSASLDSSRGNIALAAPPPPC